MSMDRSTIGPALGLGAAAYGVLWLAGKGIQAMVRHPIVTLASVGVLWISAYTFHLFDMSFGILSRDLPAMMQMNERQFAKEFGASECSHGEAVICKYDSYDMTVTFNNDKPFTIDMNAGLIGGKNYTLSEGFYRYVLERSGVPDYQAPEAATIDSIVWTSVPNVGAITLLTDDKMRASRMVVISGL